MTTTSRAAKAIVLVAVATTAFVLPGTPAAAGTVLNRFVWGDAGITISSSSNKYSNASGFVQAVVNSNGCFLDPVDGIYGPVTTWNTAVFTNNILGFNNGGVMNPTMLNNVYYARDDFNLRRLGATGFIDGYGTRYYGYYGGGALGAALGWNPISAQWHFSPFPNTNPSHLFGATGARTMGSYPPCA